VLQAPQEQLVQLDQQEFKVRLDLRVLQVTLAQQVQPALRQLSLDLPAQPALKVRLAQQVQQDPQVQQVKLAQLDQQVHRAFKVRLAHQGQLV
jgi:hypothetical protein